MNVLTVTQVNTYIKALLDESTPLRNIFISGEISNFTHYYRSGHLYFTLKDESSQLKAVMFSSNASRLRFQAENGMKVICRGRISVYSKSGEYQLYVDDMQPDGIGALSLAFEQLKEKLSQEGLFDESHKKPIPPFPSKIGVATSNIGAAVEDIKNITARRYPLAEIIICPTVVQGENAPDSICRGILKAEAAGCDVIIVGRGGGSSEDLNAFNSEKVAYAIYNCKVPVISAVGHETDFTIADLAADMRAPTPSAAAELATPQVQQFYEKLEILQRRMKNGALAVTDRAGDRLVSLNSRLSVQSPENRLKIGGERLGALEKRLELAVMKLIADREQLLARRAAQLDSLSPLNVLSRGYSLVYQGEKLRSTAESLSCGDKVRIRFGTGEAEAEIIGVKENIEN